MDFNDDIAQPHMEGTARKLDNNVADFESRLDRLTLVCMAMWSLLKEKTNLTDEELLKRVEEIDLADGKLDGRVSAQVITCPQCNRQMSTRTNRCFYCGYTREGGEFAAFNYTPPPPGADSSAIPQQQEEGSIGTPPKAGS